MKSFKSARCLHAGAAVLIAASPIFSGTAAADEAIKVSASVPYLDDSVGSPAIRAECTWNTQLVSYLQQYAAGHVEVSDAPLSGLPGKVLLLKVTHIHAVGGGGWAGPSWATITGELRQGDTILGNFNATSHSISPFHFTACGVLDKIAKQLGRYTAVWVQKPTSNAQLGDKESDAPAKE
jgi:hypothetical protein